MCLKNRLVIKRSDLRDLKMKLTKRLDTCVFTLFILAPWIDLCLTDVLRNDSLRESDAKGAEISSGRQTDYLEPTVFIAILVRNKAHVLPYFLTLLENLDYPKDRLSIWIRSDHNEDETPEILRDWTREMDARAQYHSVTAHIVDSPPFRLDDQLNTATEWTTKRFRHIVRLKEEAIRTAKKIWADFIWILDADAFIMNNQTLRALVAKNKDLVAPLLTSGSMYSNFWGGMLENFYYNRTEDYKEILDRKKIGCFEVPMIHSAVLMNLKRRIIPEFHKIEETVPEDDIIMFATNAKSKNIAMEICNDDHYGYILPPLDETQEINADRVQFENLQIESAGNYKKRYTELDSPAKALKNYLFGLISAYWPAPLQSSKKFSKWVPSLDPPSTLGFDKVWVINLKRRPDRMNKMKNVLKLLGVEYEVLQATDGKELTEEDLLKMGVVQLPNYKDPYSQRVMTYGEIGCFLSHYRIWEMMVKKHVQTALILEDDIRFEPYFKFQLQRLFTEAAEIKLDWDLMYLGRKRSAGAHEPFVEGSSYIVHVGYSYWTLGYALTLRGAKKLLEPNPLKKLIPVDEYLPMMFDRHAVDDWKAAFPIRNLKAFSAEPLLLYPTHYTGDEGYISDTEWSVVIPKSVCNQTLKDEL